jgi:hypothetical protein
MATKGMAYDHPNYIVRREHSFLTVAGATTVGGRYLFFQAARLKSWSAKVIAAGTTATAASGYVLRNGTTSLAALVLSTNAVNSSQNTVLNIDVASMADINVISGADATVASLQNIEFEYLPSGVQTV